MLLAGSGKNGECMDERRKVNEPKRAETRSTDRIAMDRILQSFFAAFCNQGQRTPRLDELRSLFSANAVIVKRSNGSAENMSVDAFIEPRQALLCSGALTEFSEWEQESETVILGSLACRWSIYGKSGSMHGEPYGGIGRKIFSFIRVGDDWK